MLSASPRRSTLRPHRWLTLAVLCVAGCKSASHDGPSGADAAPGDAAPGARVSAPAASDASTDQAIGLNTEAGGPAPDGGATSPDVVAVTPAPGCGSGLVYSGQEAVVDAFPTGPGIVIARASGVLLVDRTGQILREVKMPREVTAAAYDGTRLLVADRGMLTELRPTLELVARKPLRDFCRGVAILADGRVVCGGGAYHVVYRMDAADSGRLVAQTERAQLRVIPGTSDVISGVSLTHFPDTGPEQIAVGDTTTVLGTLFAFKGNPASHVVSVEGALLSITGSGCTPSVIGARGCFTRDDMLSTLRPQEAFVGLVEDSPTSVLALVRKTTTPYPPPNQPACGDGCFAQRIDLTQRTIVSEKAHRLDGLAWKSLRADPFCKRLMVLSRTVEEPRFDFDPEVLGDYRVQLLDYGASGGAPVFPPGGLPPLPPETAPPFAPAPAVCAGARNLVRSDEAIVDIHAAPGGVIVVKPSGLTLVNRQGVTAAEATRPVLATAFDGTRLLASDGKVVTIYDASLTKQGELATAETCSGLIFLDGDRIVCGGEKDTDRIFYTYDLQTKGELARSAPHTYGGRYMTRIPGLSSFVTVSESSSPDYNLFDLDAAGQAAFVNRAVYVPGHSASSLFGFLGGATATHLVDQSSRVQRIRGADCGLMATSAISSGCFEADGLLGNLRFGERMLGVVSDGAANVYAVVAPRPISSISDAPCARGCAVQRVDFASRQIVSRRMKMDKFALSIWTRLVPSCGT
jgi:hypothetical protein